MSAIEQTGSGGSQGVQRWLIAECAGRLAQVLEAMTSEQCQAEWLPDAAPEPDVSSWWKQPLSLGAGAEIWVGAPEAAWSAIGGRALKAAGIDEADPTDLKSTFHEILTQALSAAAQTVGGRLGREVVCQPGQESGDAPPLDAALVVEARFTGGETARTVFGFSRALLEALDPPEKRDAGPAGGTMAVAAAAAIGEPSRTLDLLLEVELPVSVSFGRAQLPLKDVLKLTTGSIVELNRSVTEPVEVIVNNCVIARGEVVVIEGNYGVRIQQIISRQERLRNLN
jgi:flagellar motor switch protein FliN/FliY